MLASFGIEVAPAFAITQDGSCACRNPNCHRPGKHPVIYDDPDTGSADAATIRSWWERHPSANGLAHTGRRSQLFVLDLDGDVGLSSLNHLQERHSALPATLTVRSGRGLHFYFRLGPDAPTLQSASDVFGTGLDARGERGWVITPGSYHASGRRYELADSTTPAAMPDWLFDIATNFRHR
ncbi:bifunctional DNA primase/polymerase [Azospirillum picis]|uniref:bifunctional DNA primase/polymerase n=1 Tax=Azospirillum picis TaxID=488438 RepID=UPI001AE4F2E4|nr:bifunctional DNA primase/polymerase [Azospirillum picis]